jgi:hypothetical protein
MLIELTYFYNYFHDHAINMPVKTETGFSLNTQGLFLKQTKSILGKNRSGVRQQKANAAAP